MDVADRKRACANSRRSWNAPVHDFPVGKHHSDRLSTWMNRLLIVAGLLALCGLLASFSTTVFLNIALDRPAYKEFIQHVVFLAIGVAFSFGIAQLVARFRPIRRWLRILIPAAFFLSLGLVAMVQVSGLGEEVNGARRFLNLGFITFQPSEMLKNTVVLYLGQLLCWWRKPAPEQASEDKADADHAYDPRSDVEHRGAIRAVAPRRNWFQRNFVRDERPVWPELPRRCILIMLGALGLTAIQPDLGSAGIIFGSSILIMLIAGVNLRVLGGFLVMLVICGMLVLGLTKAVDPGKYNYAGQRIATWWTSILSPAADEDGPAYQLAQSRGALAAGGMTGRGFLKSDQKMNRLPLSTNDFVFPVMVEELGFIGGVGIILMLLGLAYVGMRLSFCCRDPFNKAVIAALGFTICLQGFVNIGVALGTLPLSGLTLPFLSYGGTSLVITITAIGIMYSLGLSEKLSLQGNQTGADAVNGCTS